MSLILQILCGLGRVDAADLLGLPADDPPGDPSPEHGAQIPDDKVPLQQSHHQSCRRRRQSKSDLSKSGKRTEDRFADMKKGNCKHTYTNFKHKILSEFLSELYGNLILFDSSISL